MNDPEERDLAHEADMEELRKEQLAADCGGEMADDEESMGDPDEYDYDEADLDEPVCERCRGDGMDPWNDYATECPDCGGECRL